MQFRSIIALAAFAVTAAATAHDYKAGELAIAHPYARATVPNQPTGAAYMTIENAGRNADKLIGASSPVAKAVQIHSMSMQGDVMKMREVSNIELKPSTKTELKPGDGYHLMLIGLKQPLKPGDKFPITLNFEKAGKVEVSAWVEDKNAKAAEAPKNDTGSHQHH
ncbi:MAG: periplasmic copper chaperone [Burkholderiales bacterium]|jgi:copper(I)-binding protein